MSLPDAPASRTAEPSRHAAAVDVVTATIWSGSSRIAIVASMGMIAAQVIQAIERAGGDWLDPAPSAMRTISTAVSVVSAWLLAWAWFGLGKATPLMVARNQTTKASIAKWGALVFAICISVSELTPRGGEVSSSRVALLLVVTLFGQLAFAVFAFWSIAHLKLMSRELAQPAIRFNAHITHVLVWATIVLLAGSGVYAVMATRTVITEPGLSSARDAASSQVMMLGLVTMIVYCLAWGAYATTLASLRRAVQPLTFQAQAAREDNSNIPGTDAGTLTR